MSTKPIEQQAVCEVWVVFWPDGKPIPSTTRKTEAEAWWGLTTQTDLSRAQAAREGYTCRKCVLTEVE